MEFDTNALLPSTEWRRHAHVIAPPCLWFGAQTADTDSNWLKQLKTFRVLFWLKQTSLKTVSKLLSNCFVPVTGVPRGEGLGGSTPKWIIRICSNYVFAKYILQALVLYSLNPKFSIGKRYKLYTNLTFLFQLLEDFRRLTSWPGPMPREPLHWKIPSMPMVSVSFKFHFDCANSLIWSAACAEVRSLISSSSSSSNGWPRQQ